MKTVEVQFLPGDSCYFFHGHRAYPGVIVETSVRFTGGGGSGEEIYRIKRLGGWFFESGIPGENVAATKAELLAKL